ncbi:MAG: hypothetical protein LBS50_10105 [Prevotellaceae bacterium]|jgi:hypothetical protein|nr:hypothetical protein [Prevotellaceae bacterium]
MANTVLHNLLYDLNINDTNTVFFRNKENVFVNDLLCKTPQKLNLHFNTQKKLDIIQPDAIYVFNNQPFILFFDLTDVTEEKENDIHKKVWSFDSSPVIFVIKNKDIYIYNALNYIKKENCLQEIHFDTEEERNKQFSFWNLQSGDTWKWFQEQYIEIHRNSRNKKRVNEKLFQNIKEVRKCLMGSGLSEHFANSLILKLIFIRYLIDRKVEINQKFIAGNIENINDRRADFCRLIEQPERLNQLFEYLNERFNGVLFKELDTVINKEQAEFLAGVFSGELQYQDSFFEGSFFEIFDFSIIPVELISGIYESLIDENTKKLNSAVYTPPFLVDYILNNTIYKYLENSQTSDCKIFEVAVGSGIFLVQSLRRMIEKEIELNGNKDKKKFSEKIRKIAENNLFGIDINSEALKVTCFSIYIALLDYQEPRDIGVYLFPTLIDKNLFNANFFDTEHIFNKKIEAEKLNFILGNPPWKSKKDDKIHTKWLKENKKTVGGYEIAQSFLLRVKDFMKLNTQTALIITSTIFYNVSQTTKKFKNEFLTTYCLDNFFDLSLVRRLIFEEKGSPASIVTFRLSNGEEHLKNVVKHHSVKINHFLKYFKMLVIEKFDQKDILQKYFIENDWLFKVALYGNTLDFVLLKRLCSNTKNIERFIDNKNVFGGAGILKGTPKRRFIFLEGLPLNENSQIKQYFTQNSSHILSYEETYLEAGRSKKIFDGYKILFKEQAENETDIIVSYNPNPSIYKKGVFGICSSNDMIIRELYSYLISNIYSYYIFFNAGSWATSTRPQIRWKEEYLSFPIIEPSKTNKSQLISLVNQFLKPFEKHYSKFSLGEPKKNETVLSKINKIINDLYGIKGYEKDLIDYVLNVSRYQFQESKQHLLNFTTKENHYRNQKYVLEKYAEVFLQEFQKIYYDEFIQVEIYPLKHFIAMNFKFLGTKPDKQFVWKYNESETQVFETLADVSISQITNTEDPTKNLFIQKDIKGFEKNAFYIIKPNEYKCWHRAMAWYDVAEFIENVEDAELEHLNKIEE